MLNLVRRESIQPLFRESNNWDIFLQKIESYMTIDGENDVLMEINNLLASRELNINEQIEQELSLKGYQVVKESDEIDIVKQASQNFLHKGLKTAINNSNKTPLVLTKQLYEGIMAEGKSPRGKLIIDRQPELADSNVYIFESDPDACQSYSFPSNIRETLQSIINSRQNSDGIKPKIPSESPEERSLRKFQKYKKADLDRLQQIVKNIDIFCSTKESENKRRSQALYDIGQYAADIKFNDRKKYKEEYLRNKYGSIDRSDNSKSREGGLEFDYLKDLQHIAAANLKPSNPMQLNLCLSEEEYSSLIPDFELIKKKIQFIAKDENSVFTKEEISEEFKKIGVAKCIQAFVNKHYVNDLIEELIRNLTDPLLQKLDFTKREDRYYLGRVLSMIGELSKDVKNFLYPGNREGNLFSYFKRIRDDKMAHFPGALVNDISSEQLNQFHLLLKILNKFEWIVKNIKTNGLGTTTESESQQLNKLIDSLFGKKFVEVDQTILDGIGLPKTQEIKKTKETLSVIREKTELKQRNLILTLEQISQKVSKLDGRPIISQKKATIGQTLIQKPTEKQSNILKQEIQRLIECYNNAALEDHLKLVPNKIPSKEKLESLKSEIEKLGLQHLELEVAKEEKILTDVQATSNLTTLPSSEPLVDSEKAREKLQKALSMIAKEFQYIMKVLESDEIEDFKKQYVIDFAITKIGQIFIDSQENRNQLLSVFPKDHQKSIKEMTKARHKLMHEIHASNSGNRQHVLFRHALPIIPEIEALKKIASIKKDDEHALITLGRAFTEMKCYDKAIECFDQMLKLSGSHFLSITNIVSKEDEKHLTLARNALFAISEAYGKAAEDAKAVNLDADSKKYYNLKILSLKQHSALLKHAENIDTSSDIADHIASIYNKLGNTYNHLEKYDQAFASFKKAFRILKNQKSYDPKRESTYLFNIGHACTRKGFDTILGFLGTDIVSTEGNGNLFLGLAAFWEAKEIYESLQNFSKTDPFFLKIKMSLIEALFHSGQIYYPYALKMYHEFMKDLETFPIRETDSSFKYLEIVDLAKQFAETMLKDTPEEELMDTVDAKFKICILKYLRSLYLDLELDTSILNKRIDELINNSFNLKPSFIKTQKFSDLNNEACVLYRNGQSEKALPLFLDILKFLETLDLQEAELKSFMTDVYGDVLESIGDTYASLNDSQNALKYFNLSLDAHFKYNPTDRAFGIPKKCIEELDKIEENRSYEKMYLFFKEVVDKFKEHVGENDPRMDSILFAYNNIPLPIVNEEDEILLQYANKIKTASRYLIIPKKEVQDHPAFQEHCLKFMGAKCVEEKGNYKIFLNATGKDYLQQLQSRTSK